MRHIKADPSNGRVLLRVILIVPIVSSSTITLQPFAEALEIFDVT